MLVESLKDSDAPLTIVDTSSQVVRERFVSLGFAVDRIQEFTGESGPPVPSFTTQWRDELGASTLRRIQFSVSETADDPMLIDWGHNAVARILDISEEKGSALLIASPFNASWPTITPTPGMRLPTLQDALRAVGGQNVLRVVTADGIQQTIINWGVKRFDVGYGRGVWNVLVPSGPR